MVNCIWLQFGVEMVNSEKAKDDLDKYRIEIKEKETLFQLAVVEIAGKRGKWTEHVF